MTELLTGSLYLILFILVKLKVFKAWAKWMTIGPIIFFVTANVIYIVPMNWVAPQGNLVVFRNSVEITPGVNGEVLEIPVRAGKPVKRGDTLFKIDDTQSRATVDNLKAQLLLARMRLAQSEELAEAKAGSLYEVQQFETQVRGLEAELSAAERLLYLTVVRAPADGVVPDISLQVGAMVSTSQSAMPFIDGSKQFLCVQISQIHLRHIKVGNKAEFLLKLKPGKVFAAEVTLIIPANPAGQLSASGLTAATPTLQAGPYWVVIEPEDKELQFPAGAIGAGAIYTEPENMSHLFRKIMLRGDSWRNFLTP